MIKLTLDINTGWPVQGTAIPLFRQGKSPVQLRFVQPDPSGRANAFTAASMTGILGARLGLWSDSTATLDDSSTYLLALIPHTDFTYNTDDTDDPYFEGTLNCNTTEIEDWLGEERTRMAFFAVGLVRDDLTLQPVLDHQFGLENCTVASATDDASGSLPTSAVPAYTPIVLPVYFRSADGLRHYVLAENETQTGVVFSIYNP